MAKPTQEHSKRWDRGAMKDLLVAESPEGVDPDFESLLGAASTLDAESFAAFLLLFLEKGRNLRATNRAGQTALDVIRTQAQKSEYVQALAQAMSQAG